ncbi:MerR family transcriptional regulator [Phenylobacterium sp. J426]|uniref:helix-turn-helix domain-containing protein n=1 Tax=Phenylobacterium sp. J426 TaxID=2898439 RepID=UPI002151902E|nr:MerR family transcriptional regulator [Phenylobacterium sp. J426]MCR5874521.1 MerR family transcriptional regulator [Phenylobacterium sp. J426]
MLGRRPDNLHHLPRLGFADACRLFGMTPRALRFYEEKGLIEARRDRLNHRYYDGWTRQKLAWISRLRSVSLPLRDIRQVLEADQRSGAGSQLALRKLLARREELARELAAAESLLPSLQEEAA